MRHFRAILHGGICLALILLLGETTLLVRDLRVKTLPQITQAATDLDRTTVVLGATTTNFEKASRQWESASNAQIAYFSGVATRTNAVLDKLGIVADSANSILLAQQASLGTLEAQVMQNSQSLNDLEKQAMPVIQNLAATTSTLNSQLANPDIPATLHQIQIASENTAQTSANMQAATKDIASFVHRETAPVKGTWNVIKAFLREFAGPAADVTTAIK